MFIYNEPQEECDECLKKDNDLDDTKYWFRAALDQLYGLENFNENVLERALEEIAACLVMNMPKRSLVVEKKSPTTEPALSFLDCWIGFNTKYLKSLEKTGN
jgi:hypothetical protein